MLLTLVLVMVLTLLTLLLWRPIRSYLTYRGERLITCPGNGEPAAVRVKAGRAAVHSNEPLSRLAIKDCSRWPVRKDCGQGCLNEVVADPTSTRVDLIVTNWYEGKSCAFCAKPIDHLSWSDHRAAFLGPDGTTREWETVPAEDLPGIFETSRPVCWSCHIAESFRQRYPELVTNRPEH